MEISYKKLIIRYFSNPNYLCSLLSHSQPFTTVSLFSKTPNPSFPFAQSYANQTSKPRYSSISSTGSPSFFPLTPPISQSLIPLRGSHSFDQPRFGFLRPHGQFRLLSVSSSDENNEFEKMSIVGSDESKFRVSAVGKFVPNVSPKQVSEIIEVTRSGMPKLTTICLVLYASTIEQKKLAVCSKKMKEKGCPPDALTFEIFIYYSCRLGKLDAAAQFFDQMVSRGLEPQLTTHAAFVRGYFYSRQYEEAYNYVVTSSFKYKHSSNMIYSLLASLHLRKGNLITARNILVEMMDKGFSPSFSVYMRISKRLHKTGKTHLVRDLKNRFFRLRLEPCIVN
ncbi:hypothetical protein Acr_10g0006390 [Actinidia rufa]|uniref:Tetratricopeptide repeat (TPR)-like superfamily protein n=1 Tax=Actinidia rufa TaxID=165716 RepID=A0A7J0F968_9ERIC|nr:hypothetical protein Acr_10g0006390 [Actinidia rufa]